MGSIPFTHCPASTTITFSMPSSAPPKICVWSIPATSKAPPTWRSAPHYPPANLKHTLSFPDPACSIPATAIGKGHGHLHEIRDQAGIVSRLVDHSSFIEGPVEASAKIAKAIHSMSCDRPGPAAIECAIDVWGRRGPVPAIARPALLAPGKINIDKVRAAAKILGKAQRVLIVVGGGAQDASPEVTLLSSMLQAPVLGYRRGRGILDSRDPFSVTLPLGRDLWAEA